MTPPADYFDVNAEPSVFHGQFQPDPCEQKIPPIDGTEDEVSTIRDSVLNEPAFTGKLEQTELGQWILKKRENCSIAGDWGITMIAALAAGPFAVIGAFMSGGQGLTQSIYVILFGPVIEELLKQSGMIYLLEKKPYRICTSAQFIVAALVAAFIFSAIENLIYIYIYFPKSHIENPEQFALFRWIVCTSLHLTCSCIASFGLIRVWKMQLADGRAADLSKGFWYFFAAIMLHGLYNLWATLWSAV